MTLLILALGWVALSVPTALLVGRSLRTAEADYDLKRFLAGRDRLTTRRRRRENSPSLGASLSRVDVGWVVVFAAVALGTAWLCIDLIRQGSTTWQQ